MGGNKSVLSRAPDFSCHVWPLSIAPPILIGCRLLPSIFASGRDTDLQSAVSLLFPGCSLSRHLEFDRGSGNPAHGGCGVCWRKLERGKAEGDQSAAPDHLQQ